MLPLSIFVFIFGLIIGSFLNVVILRLKSGKKGIITGTSACPNCHKRLSFWDLIPVFSYILLKGRCRYCSKKVSIQYPLVELLTGIVFAIISIKFIEPYATDIPFQAILMLIYCCVLIVVSVYDLKYYELPDKVLLPAIGLALVATLFPFTPKFTDALLGASIPLAFFGAQIIISKGRWIGGGDLRLGAFMGLVLGWKVTLVALFLSYLVGAFISIFLLALKKKTAKSQVPFGPFLSIGLFIGIIWGEVILKWYIDLVF